MAVPSSPLYNVRGRPAACVIISSNMCHDFEYSTSRPYLLKRRPLPSVVPLLDAHSGLEIQRIKKRRLCPGHLFHGGGGSGIK